jgi:hypothetical protein
MPAAARLNDFVEVLEIQVDEYSSFLDRETGQVETVSHDLLREAEESDGDEELDLPTWQEHEWEIAKLIVSTDRFRKLPSKFEVEPQRVWFPEMIERLRSEWHRGMSFDAITELRDDLDAMLQRIRCRFYTRQRLQL